MTYSVNLERTPLKCARCGSEDVSEFSQTVTERGPDDVEVTFADVFSHCNKCGNEFYTPEQSFNHSRAFTKATREAQGFYSGEQIKAIRERLGLTQRQLEKALGVGKKTVVRYEKGTVPHGGAIDNLIWIADHYPTIFSRLAFERRGVKAEDQGTFVSAQATAAVTAEPTQLRDLPPAERYRFRAAMGHDDQPQEWALEASP